jgi:hypothetical protein
MKKIFLLFLLAFMASGITYGQFALGIKAGYNANKLTTDLDSVKDQVNSGFHVGVFSRFGKRLYLAPELQYSMSGAVFTDEGNPSLTGWKQKIKIGSVDIPVLVGFKLIHSDFITWRIELGPQASFNINKKVSDETSIKGPIEEASLSDMSWYFLGGTGIDILFLKFDVRYQYGLNSMIKSVESGSNNYQFDTQNQMFVVSVGWKIIGSK